MGKIRIPNYRGSGEWKKAVEMAQQLQPDIIIIDIRMPVMNDIEVIEFLKSNKFNGSFLVLSSHDDFEYVKEAMRLGAEDYLLKLGLKPEDLLKALNNIKQKILNANIKNNKSAPYDINERTTSQIVLEKCIRDLLYGNSNNIQEIRRMMKKLDISLPENEFLCMILKNDDMEIYEKYNESEIYMLSRSVEDIVRNMLSAQKNQHLIRLNYFEFLLLLDTKYMEDKTGILVNVQRLARGIQQSLQTYLNMHFDIGISDTVSGYDELRNAYMKVRGLLTTSFNNGIDDQGSKISRWNYKFSI
jgi:two-component system response regulator YesN